MKTYFFWCRLEGAERSVNEILSEKNIINFFIKQLKDSGGSGAAFCKILIFINEILYCLVWLFDCF